MKCNSLGLPAFFKTLPQNFPRINVTPNGLPKPKSKLQYPCSSHRLLRPRSPALRTRTPSTSTARCVRRSLIHSSYRSKRSKRNESLGERNERTPNRTARALVLRAVSQSQNFAFSDSSGLPLCISSTASSSQLFVRPRPSASASTSVRMQQLN